MDKFRTLIVSAAIAPAVRELAATWPGGAGMFEVPLYTGSEVTHYISTGMINGTIAEQLPYTDHSGEEPVTHEGDLEALVEAINADNPEAGATVEQIEALLTGADISTQDWREAVARLNLSTEPQETE